MSEPVTDDLRPLLTQLRATADLIVLPDAGVHHTDHVLDAERRNARDLCREQELTDEQRATLEAILRSVQQPRGREQA
ncbi:MAG TPA: hypothetical protein VHE83_06985 [Mycobacteriales bacterium]|nr:hypothetical protein [Mycobacteriales bacterium]